jgi:hypothetical protein
MTKAEYWQQQISAWQDSGLSQTAFCALQNIKLHNLQYWRKRFATAEQITSKLIPVTVHSSTQVRLILGAQVVIELPSEAIADVLSSLRERGLLHAAP